MKETDMPQSIAERLFEASDDAEQQIVDELSEILRGTRAPCSHLGWDGYDCSLELNEVPPDYRLSADTQRAIHAAGFAICFVNHTDKWETHYSFKPLEAFVESKGWRVSYPHKRGEDESGIWVEEQPATWPQKWFDTGYCVIKPARQP